MKTKTLLLSAITALTLVSCGSGGNEAANAEGFSQIESQLKDEFGAQAYYTDISILNIEGLGNVVSTTVTAEPESMEMGEWKQTQGSWEQTAEVTIEVPEGMKAADYMFQLGGEISLKKLGELVEKSKADLTKEKNIQNPHLNLANVTYPNTGDASKLQYVINLEPENGGTSFSYIYSMDGELIDMNY